MASPSDPKELVPRFAYLGILYDRLLLSCHLFGDAKGKISVREGVALESHAAAIYRPRYSSGGFVMPMFCFAMQDL